MPFSCHENRISSSGVPNCACDGFGAVGALVNPDPIGKPRHHIGDDGVGRLRARIVTGKPKHIRMALRGLLPKVLATYLPWYTPHDIPMPPALVELGERYTERAVRTSAPGGVTSG